MTKNNMDYERKALKSLYELSQATMSSETITEVFENILAKAMKIMGVEKASIMRFDPIDSSLKIIAAKGIPKKVMESVRVRIGEGISGKVFKTERPILVRDIKTRSDALRQKRYKSKSLISAPVGCFPLKVRGRAVGVINMTDKKNGKPFTPADLELLTTIAAQAAAYVHMFDLVNDLKETERMQQELEIAKEIQAALLPNKVPTLRGVSVAGRSLMADRLGGDYFDVLSSGWSPPAFVVADVSGHDIGAALLMSAFRSALRSEVGIPILPPSTVIRRMNKVLYQDLLKAEQFISMFYLQYIHSTRVVRYSSAGHHPAILYRPSSKSFKELITEGPLIGIEKGEHFYEKKISVKKGDVIVLYTDGVLETEKKGGIRFGMNRFKKVISKNASKSPPVIIDMVCKEVKKFAGDNLIKDDITLLVLKFK